MTFTDPILRVAVPSPLRRRFDYLCTDVVASLTVVPGARVRVPFGCSQAIAVVLEISRTTDLPASRLKQIAAVLDQEALFSEEVMALLAWAAEYYHHPIGEVYESALPVLLRNGAPAEPAGVRHWRLTSLGLAGAGESLSRAPRQQALVERLRQTAEDLREDALPEPAEAWRTALRRLEVRGWVESYEVAMLTAGAAADRAPRLNDEQQAAIEAIAAKSGRFHGLLLEGVTGSGKTEVYLGAIERVLAAGAQALVLVPEIGLTPQLVTRFQQRLSVPIALLHSGLSDQERLNAWLAARDGSARVVIGTRSAVFVPLQHPGLIIVDEEHDPSFKQQDGFRYSARDVAVMRAQRCGIPVVLGSATPSLETLHNVQQGRYARLHLPERAGVAKLPSIQLLDIRRQPIEDGLSLGLRQAIGRHLAAGGQVMLFLNRRGYAPTLLCHDCGWIATCARCDAHLTLHQRAGRLRCHHCGVERRADARCGGCRGEDLRPLGQGTERIEEALATRFPGVKVVRIDRDTTRRKGALQALLAQAHSGEAQILIGTQMLAKGHDFPNVTLVGVLNAEQGLYSVDFRSGERLAQLITQVAGRAGRAERPGEVLIQTHTPEHPLWHLLLTGGYAAYAEAALAERRAAGLPPYSAMTLLRAEAVDAALPHRFLEEARAQAAGLGIAGVEVLGPVPAPMERRAGRSRAQLLLQSPRRSDLHRLLAAWVPIVEGLKLARKVRWSLDVDPLDMY